MILIPIKHFLSGIASLGLASSIDLGAPRVVNCSENCYVSVTSEKGHDQCKHIFKKERIPLVETGSSSFAARLAKSYSHPCKADIYVCIFYRWIQCRPRTHLATLRNRVKSMYVPVSEIHVKFQLNMLDTNRLGNCRKKLIPKGQDHQLIKVKS